VGGARIGRTARRSSSNSGVPTPGSPHASTASTAPTATDAGLLEYLEDIIGSGVYVERIAEAEKVTEALSAQVRALRGAATGVLKEGHGLLRSVVGQ
jgi:hypothetical protein